MPDPIATNEAAELAAADRAAEALLRGQSDDRSGVSSERADELDKLFSATPDNPTAVSLNGGVPLPKPEGSPAESSAVSTATTAAASAATSVAATAVTSAADKSATKGLLDDVLPEGEKKAEDKLQSEFSDVKLRSDASPKTQESFDRVKEIAKTHIATANASVQKLTTERDDLAAKLDAATRAAGQLPPEAASELKELREFRALHDVESRPEFKEKFDAKISANLNSVYDMFKQEGIPDATLASIKAMSDDARADFIEKSVLPNLTAGQRRFVEAKILDNVNILGEKSKARDAARADADRIIGEQRAAPERTRQEAIVRVATHIKPILLRLPYLHVREIPGTATEAQKKDIEAHNTQALALQEVLKQAITDDRPESRAEAFVAVPIARYLNAQLKLATARAETAEAELKKIEAASATGRRLGQSAAAAASAAPAKVSVHTDSSSEIDKLFAASGTQ